jgi:tRNA-2-methylthio-N6-dimethylallyladenosine synthase
VLLLNTCVVRQSAEDKVMGRLASLKPVRQDGQPRLLLVMGCYVGDPAALRAAYPYVDGFFAPSDQGGVVDAVDRWLEERDAEFPASGAVEGECAVTDSVPISYGCDHHCTYCIVTLRRGPQRSLPVDAIVAETRALVARGAREITLLGQNVDAYGSDLPAHEDGTRPDLADVLIAVHAIEGLWRIRFLTSHPQEMTQRIIETAARLPKVCPCWELAVQAGDDDVLRRMARGYTAAHVRDLVGRIRAAAPGCAINTDIIVGFPGETVAQFANTLAMLEELRFDIVHVAAYSVRPGTPAAQWEDDVPAEEKERRRGLVEELQTRIAGEINAAQLGQVVDILVDGRQKGRWRGRTRTNKLVFFESAEDWLGRMAQVRVTWAGPWSMIGEVIT